MESFFQQIIKNTHFSGGSADTEDLYIFPSRRACLHFKKALTQQINKPAWSPGVISLADLVKKQYHGNLADNLTLVFELHQVYSNLLEGESETFNEFFPWGHMMLRDFDEADRYLLNGTQLFREIRDLKNLEALFQPDLNDYDTFRSFWQTFSNDPLTKMQEQFTKLWNRMGAVYASFQSHLRQHKLAYEGMAFRHLAENPLWIEELPYNRVFICGFHALTASELRIFKELEAKKETNIFWDVDPFYLDDTAHEAGHFLRKNFQVFDKPTGDWCQPKLATQPKTIDVIGVAGKVSQGQVAAMSLQKWVSENDVNLERTAVVFPDESLLVPLLYALPEEIGAINITMGYPMQLSTTNSLVDQWLRLHHDVRTEGDTFLHEQVVNLLNHPFILTVMGEASANLQERILKEQWIFPTASQLIESGVPLAQVLFSPCKTPTELINQLKSLVLAIHAYLEETQTEEQLELEFLLRFYQVLQRLDDLSNKYGTSLSVEMLQRLIRQLAQTETLPFSGEPLEGLQLMGLLETRTLDFDRIIFLSANEGKLPATKPHHSYIPFAIRKAFGLPTYDEQDSLYAYNVYRLMQRAKEIVFVHSNNMSKMNEGEPSRFLQQIEYELANGNSNIQFSRTTVHIPAQFTDLQEISIDKDQDVMDALEKFTADGERYLSPSSIATYVNCPLQFYFSQVLGLRTPDELAEDIDAIKMGNIFHGAMEVLYEPYLGKQLTESDYAKLKSNLEMALLETYRQHYTRSFKKPVGKNVLNYEFMKRSAEKIFELEKREGATVQAIETKEYGVTITVAPEGQKHVVSLNGYLDRLDEVNGAKRIIDYKTGGVVEVRENYLSDPTPLFEDPKFKANLQGLIYALLYLKHHPDETVEVGFYHLRDLRDGLKKVSVSPIGLSDLAEFREQLTQTISDIYNPTVPFSQTEDVGRCSYCPFKGICER